MPVIMSTPRKIRCAVDGVSDHGGHVYTVSLVPEYPVPVFRPGQFLHLTLDEYDPSACWPESRVFSIASSPMERSRLTVIYSVKGRYTARMEGELGVGKAVWVKLPYGEFVVDGSSDAVLIAGGTGITAFLAFVKGLAPEHSPKVVLLYGARRPDLLLGREVIEQKRAQVSRLQTFYFSETGGGKGVAPGRVTLERLSGCSLDLSALYYLAGPPSMVTALSRELAQRGVPVHNIRVDAWE